MSCLQAETVFLLNSVDIPAFCISLQLAAEVVAEFCDKMGITSVEELEEYSILATKSRGDSH